jgi:hypothetical protein
MILFRLFLSLIPVSKAKSAEKTLATTEDNNMAGAKVIAIDGFKGKSKAESCITGMAGLSRCFEVVFLD